MSLRFAAARTPSRSPVARALRKRTIDCVANDNGANVEHDRMLKAALRHFGEYGLGAARKARQSAEAAFFAGDRELYDWWLGICRVLDRRLAAELETGTSSKSA